MSLERRLSLALALSLAACAGRGDADPATPEDLPDSVFVEAFNDHFYDARIHAIYIGGERQTLGTIAGNGGHGEIVLAWQPRALVFEVSFIIGRATYVSLPVDVRQGEYLELRVPPNIDESGFFRRVSRN